MSWSVIWRTTVNFVAAWFGVSTDPLISPPDPDDENPDEYRHSPEE